VFGETAVGALVAEIALAPVLALTHGAVGALAGISVAVPMLVKRVVGNAPAPPPRAQTYRNRLLFDRDPRVASDPLCARRPSSGARATVTSSSVRRPPRSATGWAR